MRSCQRFFGGGLFCRLKKRSHDRKRLRSRHCFLDPKKVSCDIFAVKYIANFWMRMVSVFEARSMIEAQKIMRQYMTGLSAEPIQSTTLTLLPAWANRRLKAAKAAFEPFVLAFPH